MSKAWFITGVGSGIGRALADAAVGRGDTVVGTARTQAQADAFAAVKPGMSHGLALDMDDHDAVPGVVDRALALAGGRIDIAVNNAGRSLWAAIEEVPMAEAKALFATNVFGPLAVMQAFIPHFRAHGGGTFVNVSSGCGLFGVPGIGTYCGSKFALEGISETAAMELAAFGVHMMIVEPGAVQTNFISQGTREVGTRAGNYAYVDGGKAMLDDYYATGALSAESVAGQILAALDTDKPPLRLIVGDDVRAGLRAKMEGLAQI